jgi:serine protease
MAGFSPDGKARFREKLAFAYSGCKRGEFYFLPPADPGETKIYTSVCGFVTRDLASQAPLYLMKTYSKVICLAALALSVSGLMAAPPLRVWIEFEPGSGNQVAAAARAAGGQIHHRFDDLAALAVTVPAAALDGLTKNPRVVFVEPDPERYLLATDGVPYGIDLVRATEVHNGIDAQGTVTGNGSVGTGIKVGVIDSGISIGHEEFAGITITGGGLSNWNHDLDGHGTHVSGTIAAQVNDKGVVGVSPGVSLHVFRVFDDAGKWTYSSSLLAAARACRDARAKIISMSLGGGVKSRTEESGLRDLYEKDGILLVAAAGNDGSTRMSYPASYASVVSVAAVDSNAKHASFSQANSQVELAAPGVDVLSASPFLDTNRVGIGPDSFHGAYIYGGARGTASGILVDGGLATSTNSSWNGKVVLVRRGDISFEAKVKNVQNSGGLAALIYNNAEGSIDMTLGSFVATIPAISFSGEDGVLLTGRLGQAAAVESSVVNSSSGYQLMTGTSMATPHVSGVAALVWSAAPALTAKEVRSLLTSTARDIDVAGFDNRTGHGLVDAHAAWLAAGGGSGGGGGGGGPDQPGDGDTDAPVISNIQSRVTNTKNGSFEITFSTNEPATGSITFTSGASGTHTGTAGVTNHKFSFRGTKGATYTYTVTATDPSGNTSFVSGNQHQN